MRPRELIVLVVHFLRETDGDGAAELGHLRAYSRNVGVVAPCDNPVVKVFRRQAPVAVPRPRFHGYKQRTAAGGRVVVCLGERSKVDVLPGKEEMLNAGTGIVAELAMRVIRSETDR